MDRTPTPDSPAATCPPHYWLIEGTQRQQHWHCRRCGAEQDPPVAQRTKLSAYWRTLPLRRRRP